MIDDDRRPPEQCESLLAVVRRHFPDIREDDIRDPKGLGRKHFSVYAQVWELDDDLRRCCLRIASYGAEPDVGEVSVEYAQKHRPTVILRGLASALKRGDRDAYAKWRRQETDAVRRLIGEAKADVTGDHSWTVSETLELVTGAGSRWLADVYLQAVEIAGKPGRRPEEWQDEAARLCAELWSCLSGLPVRQPSHAAGSSTRAGKMTAFVQDALAVYRQFGLRAAPDSGSAWRRILTPLVESPTRSRVPAPSGNRRRS